MKSSQKSKSPRALSRQHSREPSVSPRFNGGPALSSIRLLRRQSPVRDSLSPFPSFNGGPALSPVSVYNPLPRRIQRSITQLARVPSPPKLVALNDWLNFQDQNRVHLQQAQQQFQKQTELPLRITPRSRAAQAAHSIDTNAPFRARMSSFEIGGPVILTLDDKTFIDMGVNNIDDAIKLISRYDNNGGFIYSIVGMVPEFKMIITEDGRIIHMRPPKNGGRTRARKIGRKGRKGTNKRRRYIVAKTRLRRGNKLPRTLRN